MNYKTFSGDDHSLGTDRNACIFGIFLQLSHIWKWCCEKNILTDSTVKCYVARCFRFAKSTSFCLKILEKGVAVHILKTFCAFGIVCGLYSFKGTTRCFAHDWADIKLQWLSVFVEV